MYCEGFAAANQDKAADFLFFQNDRGLPPHRRWQALGLNGSPAPRAAAGTPTSAGYFSSFFGSGGGTAPPPCCMKEIVHMLARLSVLMISTVTSPAAG